MPVMILGVVITVASVILTAPLKPHFPPENEEIIARRQNPENGFFHLINAGQYLDRVVAPPAVELQNPWLATSTMDTSEKEQLSQYFEKIAPSLEEIRKALRAKYCMVPDTSSEFINSTLVGVDCMKMGRALVVRGRCMEMEGKYRDAMSHYLEALQLGSALERSDGPYTYRGLAWYIENEAMTAINSSLQGFNESAVLREALRTLTEIQATIPPLRHSYELTLYNLDVGMAGDPMEFAGSWGSELRWNIPKIDILRRLVIKVDIIRLHRNMAQFYDEFLEVVDKPYLEFRKAPLNIPGDFFGQRIVPRLIESRAEAARYRAHLNGTMVAIALRLYRIERGDYPDNLDALVPAYLDSMPLDPFTGSPFHYEKAGDDFRLYGYGIDGKDDGGTGTYNSGDLIIHLPREEWEAVETKS